MTGRAFIVSMITVGVVLAVAASGAIERKPAGLPAKTAARVVEHRVQTIVDSTRILELAADNRRLAHENRRLVGLMTVTDSLGMAAHRRADTLQAVAIAALTAADSARAWEAAHANRKAEADAAWQSVAYRDTIIARKDTTLANAEAKYHAEQAGRRRADSLVAELEPLAAKADQCTLVLGIRCPTRREVFWVALLTGAAAGVAVARAPGG